MPDVDITGETVFPTSLDVGGGRTATEQLMSSWLKALMGQNFVMTGFALPSSDPDLTISIPAGTATIAGFYVSVPGATNVTLTASATNHLYLKLLKDGNGNVTGAKVEHNTTGTQPADSVKIGTAVCSGSAVTSTTDYRPTYPLRRVPQAQVFTGSGTFTVPAGVTEIYVEVYGASGGGGGGGDGDNAGTFGMRGGQGAAGGLAAGVLSVTPGAQHTTTIGTAGAAGVGNGGAGGGGSVTSFSSGATLLQANGGGGGAGGPAAVATWGSSTVAAPGTPGGASIGASVTGVTRTGAGGAGGSGGAGDGTTGGGAAGAAGQAGMIIIYY